MSRRSAVEVALVAVATAAAGCAVATGPSASTPARRGAVSATVGAQGGWEWVSVGSPHGDLDGGEHAAGEVHVDGAVRASPRWTTGASLRLVRAQDDLGDAVFEGVVLAPLARVRVAPRVAARAALGVGVGRARHRSRAADSTGGTLTTTGVLAVTGAVGVEADVLRWARGALTFVVDLRLLETEPVAYYSDDLAVRSVAVLAELVWVVRL